MKHIESSILAIAAAAVLGACSSTPVAPPAPVTSAAPAASTSPQRPSAAATPTPGPSVASTMLPPHKDPNSAISRERSVYFDYDDFAVKDAYRGVIENHGKYLHGNPSLTIRIEGNADERGSSEYNLALGQRRAESVLHALQVYGVKDSQMEPVSYGKERPKATGHDETAWAQNRRADIAYRN